MIACIFHQGSGMGNQLARYVAVRFLAMDKGYEFGVINPENFKGKDFINLDIGVPINGLLHEYNEKRVYHSDGSNITPYDPVLLTVEDFTLVDGELQDEKYFEHHIDEVREWLKCEPKEFRMLFTKPEDTCVISFRGGEYVGVESLFLKQSYWDEAMAKMREINPAMKFGVVTDDPITAQKFFPNFDIRHEMHFDWSAVREAHNLILSNSSFAILPALLNTNAKNIIAPLYWAGHNKGYWQLEQNNYKRFTFI